jgi:type II secretory pathway component GspD/PulD (secretin)
MNRLAPVFLAVALSSAVPNVAASAPLEEDERPAIAAAAEDTGVPIHTVIRAIAKKTGKKFIIDSRLHGNVQLIGEEAGNVTYSELLVILQAQGFTAVETAVTLAAVPRTRSPHRSGRCRRTATPTRLRSLDPA